jgi:hypothetical protein
MIWYIQKNDIDDLIEIDFHPYRCFICPFEVSKFLLTSLYSVAYPYRYTTQGQKEGVTNEVFL